MTNLLILATKKGLYIYGAGKEPWELVRRSLLDQNITTVIAREGVILAGTQAGVFRSDDLGISWQAASQGLSVPHVRWLAYNPDVSDFELAGTEPAAIFISKDGGRNWTERVEVTSMRKDYGWSLPYSPEAGAVRGFALEGQHGYAAVEDGGVLISNNGGMKWELAPGSIGSSQHNPPPGVIHSDVHSIVIHPGSPNRVVAPTGGGLYRSEDGGRTWDLLYSCYTRAVWLDAENPDRLVFGPADGVDRRGRIEQSFDGGKTWQPADQGLETPWPETMVERFHQFGNQLLAVLSNGALLKTGLENLDWCRVLPEAPFVQAVEAMEV